MKTIIQFFAASLLYCCWFLLFALPTAVVVQGHAAGVEQELFSCKTPESTVEDRQAVNRALGIFHSRKQAGARVGDKEVSVCFHVVTQSDGSGQVSDVQLQLTLDSLNEAFSASSCCDTALPWCNLGDCSVETGFTFVMAGLDGSGDYEDATTYTDVTDAGACVTRTVNNGWSSGNNDNVMKTALRRGGMNVLNVYWLNEIQGAPPGRIILGYATFPFDGTPSLDGVVMNSLVAPFGGLTGLDSGDIVVHEVSHCSLFLLNLFVYKATPYLAKVVFSLSHSLSLSFLFGSSPPRLVQNNTNFFKGWPLDGTFAHL